MGGGACTFDNMVQMFQSKMAGDGNDPDDLIVQAFKAYEFEGKIDAGMFKHALMTWGDKFSAAEVDDIFGEFEIDEDNIQVQGCHWSLCCPEGGREEGRSPC